MNAYDILVGNKNFAVIGVSSDAKRFSNKIYKLLEGKGKHVFGVNPRLDSLDGDVIYDSISDIPEDIDVCVMVVNPELGKGYLKEIKDKGIEYLWLQPGTVDEEILTQAKDLGLQPIEACVLVEYGKHESK